MKRLFCVLCLLAVFGLASVTVPEAEARGVARAGIRARFAARAVRALAARRHVAVGLRGLGVARFGGVGFGRSRFGLGLGGLGIGFNSFAFHNSFGTNAFVAHGFHRNVAFVGSSYGYAVAPAAVGYAASVGYAAPAVGYAATPCAPAVPPLALAPAAEEGCGCAAPAFAPAFSAYGAGLAAPLYGTFNRFSFGHFGFRGVRAVGYHRF